VAPGAGKHVPCAGQPAASGKPQTWLAGQPPVVVQGPPSAAAPLLLPPEPLDPPDPPDDELLEDPLLDPLPPAPDEPLPPPVASSEVPPSPVPVVAPPHATAKATRRKAKAARTTLTLRRASPRDHLPVDSGRTRRGGEPAMANASARRANAQPGLVPQWFMLVACSAFVNGDPR
jgi:hypothetical protein